MIKNGAMSTPWFRDSLLAIIFGLGLLIAPSLEAFTGHRTTTAMPAARSGHVARCDDCYGRCDGCTSVIGCPAQCSTLGIAPPAALGLASPLGRFYLNADRANPIQYLSGPDPDPPRRIVFH